VKFAYIHHMQYDQLTDSGTDWPVPNHLFDPNIAVGLYRDYIDNKVFAEECGFDWIVSNEHHMSPYGMMPNPNLIGAVVAERTATAGILQAGNILPLNNPIRVAEEYAMLDVLSGGRLVAGFMRGIPHEYVAYNADPDESYGRMYEAVDLIKKCWTEPEPFGWEGEFYQFRAVSIWPRPVQAMPTIVMSGGSELSSELCAAHRSVMGILRVPGFAYTKAKFDDFRERCDRHGWIPGPEHLMVALDCVLAETLIEARKIFEKSLEHFSRVLSGGTRTAQRLVLQKSRYFKDQAQAQERAERLRVSTSLGVDDLIDRGLVICGTPDMAVQQINRMYDEVGAGILTMACKIGNTPNGAVRRTMELLRDEVFPKVRHLGEPALPKDNTS